MMRLLKWRDFCSWRKADHRQDGDSAVFGLPCARTSAPSSRSRKCRPECMVFTKDTHRFDAEATFVVIAVDSEVMPSLGAASTNFPAALIRNGLRFDQFG